MLAHSTAVFRLHHVESIITRHWKLVTPLDYSSFSNIWYWLCLVTVWAYATHQIGGVPFYQLQFAKRQSDDNLQEELRLICQLNANRLERLINPAGLTFFGLLWGFIFGFWGYTTFAYDNELLEAGLLLVLPIFLVMLLRLRVLRTISALSPDFAQLYRILWWHRFWIMLLGALVLFLVVIWGMVFNLHAAL